MIPVQRKPLDPLAIAWMMITPFIVFALLMTAVEQPVTSGWIFLATFLLAVVIFIGVMVWIVAKAAAEGWEEIFRF
jgi:hypothetical protein